MTPSEISEDIKRKANKDELKLIKECITEAGNVRRAVDFADTSHSVYTRLISGKPVKLSKIKKFMEFCNNIQNS